MNYRRLCKNLIEKVRDERAKHDHMIHEREREDAMNALREAKFCGDHRGIREAETRLGKRGDCHD